MTRRSYSSGLYSTFSIAHTGEGIIRKEITRSLTLQLQNMSLGAHPVARMLGVHVILMLCIYWR
jgi:hypothetical protein